MSLTDPTAGSIPAHASPPTAPAARHRRRADRPDRGRRTSTAGYRGRNAVTGVNITMEPGRSPR